MIVLCTVQKTFHRFQGTVYQVRTCTSCFHGDVVMLSCSSFTQSEGFFSNLSTHHQMSSCGRDKLHSHADEIRVRERFHVKCSDLVATIFRTLRSMFDKLLHLSKSESFAMSCSRSCNLCGAISNLLTVTMYFQDTLSRFHGPDLHKVDLRFHVTSASTRTLAFHESQSC